MTGDAHRDRILLALEQRAQSMAAHDLAELAHEILDRLLSKWGIPIWDVDGNPTPEATQVIWCALRLPKDPRDLPGVLIESAMDRILKVIQQVNDELGPDALILSNRRVPDGVEMEGEEMPGPDSDPPVPPRTENWRGRFLAMVEPGPDGCMDWRGAGGHGASYGTPYLADGATRYHARRSMLWLLHGFYTTQARLRWSCKRRTCVNPVHWASLHRVREGRKAQRENVRSTEPAEAGGPAEVHRRGPGLPRVAGDSPVRKRPTEGEPLPDTLEPTGPRPEAADTEGDPRHWPEGVEDGDEEEDSGNEFRFRRLRADAS